MPTYFLKDNIQRFETLKGKLPEEIYLPLNTGRFSKRTEDNSGKFYNERPNDAVNLSDWIQHHLDEGDLIVTTDNVVTTNSYSIGGDIYNENTDLSIIIEAIIDNLSGVTNSDKHFSFISVTPNSTYTLNHNLNKVPAVTILGIDDVELDGQVTHLSSNTIQISFSQPIACSIYLN